MKILQSGRLYVAMLGRQELDDLLTCVEAYVTNVTSPSAEPDESIKEFYPVKRVSPPVAERFWRIHAQLATRCRAP